MKHTRILMIAALAFVLISAEMSAQKFINTVVTLTGTVVDHVTRKPMAVDVQIFDKNQKRIGKSLSNAKDGYYLITGLKPGNTYKVTVSSNNCLKQEFNLTVPNTDKYLELSKDILVIPTSDGIKVPLSVAAFEPNKAKVKFGAEELLDSYIQILKLNPTVKFKILAFPDTDQDKQANNELTKARAEALKELFVKKGIKAERINVESSDSTDPKNPPPSGKAAKGKRYTGTNYLVLTSF